MLRTNAEVSDRQFMRKQLLSQMAVQQKTAALPANCCTVNSVMSISSCKCLKSKCIDELEGFSINGCKGFELRVTSAPDDGLAFAEKIVWL